MEYWMWWAIVGAIILWIAVTWTITSKRKHSINSHLADLTGFDVSQKIIGADGKSGLAVDEQRKEVCLLTLDRGEMSSRTVAYRDILSSEIAEDGSTVTKTVRSSQVGGALLGGLALGGVGAIIGGLSGKKKSHSKVSRITLCLTINDTANPIHIVSFLTPSEAKTASASYKREAMETAQRWHGLIDVLIRQADSEDRLAEPTQDEARIALSVADEIQKLADLRERGLLTDQEFENQKRQLLSP